MSKRSPRRNSVEAKDAKWRRSVKEIDGGFCKLHFFVTSITCWGNIECHHIEGKQARPDLRYDISNGICLCQNHHDWVGRYPKAGRDAIDMAIRLRI